MYFQPLRLLCVVLTGKRNQTLRSSCITPILTIPTLIRDVNNVHYQATPLHASRDNPISSAYGLRSMYASAIAKTNREKSVITNWRPFGEIMVRDIKKTLNQKLWDILLPTQN